MIPDKHGNVCKAIFVQYPLLDVTKDCCDGVYPGLCVELDVEHQWSLLNINHLNTLEPLVDIGGCPLLVVPRRSALKIEFVSFICCNKIWLLCKFCVSSIQRIVYMCEQSRPLALVTFKKADFFCSAMTKRSCTNCWNDS